MSVAVTQVRKRDGRIVPFDRERIANAIFKAAQAVDHKDGRRVAERITDGVVVTLERDFFGQGRVPSVEEIQDLVEAALIENGYVRMAKSYILYREQRAQIRETGKLLLDSLELMDDYLECSDWRVNENANMNYSLQGLNFHVASAVSARYWLHKIYPPEVQGAHIEGDFHIHDLSILAAYCCGWDLQDLLVRGFGGVPAKTDSKPPKHLRSALGQIVNFFYTLQGESAGAQAFSNFDTLLAPFARYDGLGYRGVKQAIQEFVFNINVPTRVGFQSLVWEELVVVRRNDHIEVTEIGRLVDEQFERNAHRVLSQGNNSYAVENADDAQALAFDQDGRVVWAPIKAFVRHRVPKGATFVHVRTSRGNASVSQAHSLFAFEELDGSFAPQPMTAQDVEVVHGNASITPDNHFIAVRQAPNGGTQDALSLVELIDAMPQIADRTRVRVPDPERAVERLRQRVRGEFGGFTPFYLEYGIKDKGCWKSWGQGGSLPYRVWRALGGDEPEAEFALRNSVLWYGRTLEGNRLAEFVRLLAWYITEGHNDITNGLYVSQARGSDQKEMERVMGALGALGRIEEMEGWSAQGNPTSKVLRMAGKGLLAALIGYLGGTYSTHKVVPWFVYDLTPELQEILIATLMRGDGSEYDDHYDYHTTSKKLSLGLSLLLAMNGYKFSVYETSYERETWNDQYIIRIYKDKDAAERHAVGDLLARVCLQRESFSYEREYEYDLSVDTELENFAGGSGLLCFHNTPFTNLTMDLVPPSTLRDMPVIIGGELKEETYGDFQHEMDLINRAFAEVMLEGDAKGRVFSVDSDALCPIKNSGRFKLVRIGEFIDDFMKKSPPVFIEEKNCEVLDVRDLNLTCIGLKNGQLGWQKINYLIRHPQREVLKITTVGGFNTRVTSAHSVLVLKDGKIQAYPAGKLNEGDYLVAPKKLPREERRAKLISLAHEFMKKEKEEIYIRGVQKDGKLYKETRYCRGKYKYRYQVEIFPLENISTKLHELDLSEAKLSLAGSKIKISNCLSITKDLVEFLGWYCAEGSAEKGKYGGVSLGLNLQKERKRAHHLVEVIRRIFPNVPVSLREAKERSLVEIRIHSKLVRRIIKEVFEIENGEGKRVPQIIFELDPGLKRVFLESYFKGDAWITENIVATSISRELIYGISTILKQLDVSHTLEEYSWKGKKRYRVLVFNNKNLKAKDSHTISKIPLKESGLEKIVSEILRKEPFYLDDLGRKYNNTKKRIFQKFGISNQKSTNQENVEKIATYAQDLKIKLPPVFEEVLEGDISFLRIKEIEKANSTNGMVYDFSTESETFVADQLVVHNTFPIPTYNISKDFDWENSLPEAIWQMTAKYGIPYFASFMNSDMSPDDARSMCCRLRLDNRELRKRGGGYFGANPLTGSIGVVTINLARLGYLAKDEEDFFRRLEQLMEIAKTSLEIKRKALERFTERGLYPYARHYLGGIKKIAGGYWANHFSTIGLNGMNEACLNFLGVSIAHPDGKALALKTLNFMREKLRDFQAEMGNLYNLEATPAEGASYRLAKVDKAHFPDIITAGTGEAPYYTNSTHLPVGYTDDVFEALEHQDDLQALYTGGTVFHAFLGERVDDWRQARLLVRRIAENFRLPYYTLTPTFSICPIHGYISGEHFHCPYDHTPEELKAVAHEDSKVPCEVYSRIVGYLRPIRNWNVGKKQEFAERKEYVVEARTVS